MSWIRAYKILSNVISKNTIFSEMTWPQQTNRSDYYEIATENKKIEEKNKTKANYSIFCIFIVFLFPLNENIAKLSANYPFIDIGSIRFYSNGV